MSGTTVEPRSKQMQLRDVTVHHTPAADTVAEGVYENDADMAEGVYENENDVDEDVHENDADMAEGVYENDNDVTKDVYENDNDVAEDVYENDNDVAEDFRILLVVTDGGPAPVAQMPPFLTSSQWACVVITASAAVAMLLLGLFITGHTESRPPNPPYPTAPTTIVHAGQIPTDNAATAAAYTVVWAANTNVLSSTSHGYTAQSTIVTPTATLGKDAHTSVNKEETTEEGGKRHVITFGGRGSTLGKFAHLSGVVVSNIEIFIADYDHDNGRVQVFNMKGDYVLHFLTTVPGKAGRTFFPQDISIDDNGNLWVVGRLAFFGSYVVQYNRDGQALTKFEVKRGSSAIAVNLQSKHILVTRYGMQACDIDIFQPNGLFVRTLDTDTSCEHMLAANREGNIITTRNNMVQVYDQTGHLLFTFGGSGVLKYIRGICADITGHILVSDEGNMGEKGRVSMFSSRGHFVRDVVTGLNMVERIAVGVEGQLVVTDVRDRTVTIYTTY
ncbi:uncharacterized protein LOC118406506 [Branchiostoma floridae]|uniref:Uncharacterized protein LOC118406506 n=1 Tax=Branchiostoma floridae TaxID=7739 RepID=A0A9J7HQA3_BRAFL|nr:uncharacterized protein LOC118406506 [Branchiostoma floridae]